MVSAQLAAALLGWCYVPLDPAWPAARLRTMVELADPDVVLVLGAGPGVEVTGTVTCLDVEMAAPAPIAAPQVEASRPAYIMFTSGSTGLPKGVVHTHRSVLHGIGNHLRNFELGAADVVTLLSSFCFDMAVSDLYGGLLSGATVLTHDTPTLGLANLLPTLRAAKPTVFHSTPTVFRFLSQAGSLASTGSGTDSGSPPLRSVRMALLGGEPTHLEDIDRATRLFGPDTTLVNGYGSTEASFSVQRFIDLAAPPTQTSGTGVLDIGHALNGYHATIDRPDADGVGEILIHSDHLSLGYWRDPARTAERYSRDGRTYRTGDLARTLPDGALEPAGRSDRQVKVNGVRVELDEIENALESDPFVTRGVAFMVPGTLCPELVAYAVSAEPRATVASVRERLAGVLPRAVIPQHLRVVTDIPLTLTGKADVLALRARHLTDHHRAAADDPGAGATELDSDQRATLAPATAMTACWTTALGHRPAGPDVPFLEAGGSSLQLATLQLEIQRTFETAVSLSDLMIHSTIRAMTSLVSPDRDAPPAGDTVRRRQDAVAARMRRRSAKGR